MTPPRCSAPAVSLFVVILAQSAATSRAYAGKYEEAFSQDTDLVGLGAANVAAALSGAFVVNGSPTQTQVADSAGGRSQLAQLTTSAVVLIVLLLLTGPLASLPIAALAAIVFLIAAGLIDVAGLRRILACRRHEFAIALLTTAAVVILGVEQGIVLAVAASVIDHLRHSYNPRITGTRVRLEDANVRATRQGTVDARGVGPSGRYRLRCVVTSPWQPARVPAVRYGDANHGDLRPRGA